MKDLFSPVNVDLFGAAISWRLKHGYIKLRKLNINMTTDYIVKHIALSEFGRKGLNIGKTEMPGLIVCCADFDEVSDG
jgi:hypothetical protein